MAWTTVRVSTEVRDALNAIAGNDTHEDTVRRLLTYYINNGGWDGLAQYQQDMLEKAGL